MARKREGTKTRMAFFSPFLPFDNLWCHFIFGVMQFIEQSGIKNQ